MNKGEILELKDKIIDNAITLFSEKGYDGTTLDDISRSVTIITQLMDFISFYLSLYSTSMKGISNYMFNYPMHQKHCLQRLMTISKK